MRRLLLPLFAALLLVATPATADTTEAHEDATVVAAATPQHDDPHAQDEHAEESHGDEHADDHGDDHGDDAHGAGHGDDHGDGHGDGHHGEHLELPHLMMVLRNFGPLKDSESFAHWSHVFENSFFAMLGAAFLMIVAAQMYKRRAALPNRLQALFEIIVEQALNITITMMGEKYGRKYAPFIMSIFLYLLVQNYSGIIPLGKAPSATFLNNISIALCVFLYVQYTGIKRLGIGGYLHHLCGSPKDAVSWGLAPLMFVLEFVGELVKPISLSLRLFGNIFGKDTLLAVFALLGVVSLTPLTGGWVGLPLHLPFFFLALLLGLIQALVFSLLATVYISMMLPHDHDHGDEHHGEEVHA